MTTGQKQASPRSSDFGFVFLMILLIGVITAVPYWYAARSSPPGKVFMGMLLDVPDHLQYFSWMRELSVQWFSANKLTPEPNQPLFFNLLWLILGRIGRAMHWTYARTFQLLRIMALVVYAPLVYQFCRWYFPETRNRRLAFLVITFGAGFGWVMVVMKYLLHQEIAYPLALYVAEPNSFLSLLAYPHFSLALLYLGVFLLYLRFETSRKYGWTIAAGLLGFLIGWMHAYDLILVYAVLGTYALLTWLRQARFPLRLAAGLVIVGLLSFPPALYSYLLTAQDPIWQQVLAQFANAGVFTPPPFLLIVLMGFAFLLALYSAVKDGILLFRSLDREYLFIFGWFMVSFALVYLPVDFQIHMLNGWQIPAGILAAKVWVENIEPCLLKRAKSKRRSLAAAGLLILLVIPTNLYLYAWRFLDLSRHASPYYLRTTELAAMKWLEANAEEDDVVLSSIAIGQYIPAETGTHAYLAHWAQTVDFFRRTEDVERFFTEIPDTQFQAGLLNEEGIDYVFFGPEEKALGAQTLSHLGLSPVFQQDEVIVYQVGAR